jgi:hypothetical protein
VKGACLCGSVGFEIDGSPTAIEFCHCSRCRKAYGSAFAATFYVMASEFRWMHGQEFVAVYEAPLQKEPPPYRHVFCRGCGSPLPIVMTEFDVAEIPAGTLDGDPVARPLRHVFVRKKAPWFEITDALPQHREHVRRSEHLVAMLLRSRHSGT